MFEFNLLVSVLALGVEDWILYESESFIASYCKYITECTYYYYYYYYYYYFLFWE
jgi:hypothetical protein